MADNAVEKEYDKGGNLPTETVQNVQDGNDFGQGKAEVVK